MEDLGHTPVLKSNDLQSLTDTLNMRLTEIEFENRFSGLFHEDLPVPLPKNVSGFVYPSIKKRSQKRKAPVPPKAKESEGIVNYRLQNLQELGPILAKSATLPPNMNYRVKVKVKSQSTRKSSQHATLIGYSSLVSVFKIRQTSSLKIRKKTFRKAIRKKNRSLSDLFSVTDSTEPSSGNRSTLCDGACESSCARCIRKEENSECPSTNCVEDQSECPQASSVLQPLPEMSCISPLVIPFSELGIFHTQSEQRSPKQEYDKSIVEDSPSRACMISNSTGLQASSQCKQNSPRFNHTCEQGIHTCLLGSPSDMQKSSSYAQDGPSHIKDSFSTGEVQPSCAHNSLSSGHGNDHCMHSSPSSGRGSDHCMHGSPSSSRGSDHCMHGSPSSGCGSPLSGRGSDHCMRDSPSSGHGSAHCMRDSPSSGHGSAHCMQGSSLSGYNCAHCMHCNHSSGHNCAHRMHSSPSSGHGSAHFMHSSPAHMDGSAHFMHSSPSPMDGSPSWVHSSPAMQGISSHVHHSQSHHLGSPLHQLRTMFHEQSSHSFALDSPSHSYGSPSRAHGSPSRAHGSPSRAHGSPSRAHGSPSRAHGSPSRAHGSPSRAHGSTPCHALGNQSYVRSSPSSSSRGSPPVHESSSQLDKSPSQVMGSPSCVQHRPLHNRSNNTRMCGYPSWLQDSLLEQSIPMQNGPKDVLNSPSKDREKTLAINPNNSSFINKLNELENEMEKPCFTSYYKKQLSCDHIYEEVDESCLNLSGLDMSSYPPPVPSNSPCISPEILRHSGYMSDDNQLLSVKKTAPQKPPRNRSKEVVLQNGSLAFENCSRFEDDDCNKREGSDDLDLKKITKTGSVNTADNTGEISSDLNEQEKNEAKHLKTYFFGENFSPDHYSTRKSLPRQSKKSTSSPVSGSRSPGSPSFRAKKPKHKNSRRKFSIPKTFRFSLKTSLGNIRLSGKRFFTRTTRHEPQEKALGAYKSWQGKKSPAIISPHNVRIPRIIIHVETPEAGDSYGPEIQEQLEDLNTQSGENTLEKTSPTSPVPSILSVLNNYEGCDLSVVESQDDFYTPHSYLDNEEQEECSEVEFLGATAIKSSLRSTCLPPDEKNDDVICIGSVNTLSQNRQPGFARSQPDLSSLRSGDEEEVIFLGASKCSRLQTDLMRTSIKDSRLLKENSMYFHSYDDLQIILNSN